MRDNDDGNRLAPGTPSSAPKGGARTSFAKLLHLSANTLDNRPNCRHNHMVKPMSGQGDKLPDVGTLAASALLILVRLALAIAFAYFLAFMIFDPPLQPTRLFAGALVSVVGILAAGALLRQYRFLPAVVLNAFCIATLLFLAIAWYCQTSHIPPRSPFAEASAVIICVLVSAGVVIYPFHSKRRRKA